jgi:hypothetical protein
MFSSCVSLTFGSVGRPSGALRGLGVRGLVRRSGHNWAGSGVAAAKFQGSWGGVRWGVGGEGGEVERGTGEGRVAWGRGGRVERGGPRGLWIPIESGSCAAAYGACAADLPVQQNAAPVQRHLVAVQQTRVHVQQLMVPVRGLCACAQNTKLVQRNIMPVQHDGYLNATCDIRSSSSGFSMALSCLPLQLLVTL